eukprot:2646145-Rhodomonas_salina.1
MARLQSMCASYLVHIPVSPDRLPEYEAVTDEDGMLSRSKLLDEDRRALRKHAGTPPTIIDKIGSCFKNASSCQESSEILQKQDIYQAIFQTMVSMRHVSEGLVNMAARNGYDLDMAISNIETAVDALLVAEEQIAFHSGMELKNHTFDIPDHHHIEYENKYYSMQPLDSGRGESRYTPPEGSVATPLILQNGRPVDAGRRLDIY